MKLSLNWIFLVLQAVFILLRLIGVARDWPWYWVLAPLLCYAAFTIFVFATVLAAMVVLKKFNGT